MQLENTEIEGVYIINNFNASDERGLFAKTFNKEVFEKNDLEFSIRESYFSISQKDVIRGMHFQLPPNAHEKLVYVPQGSILDIVVDLRKESATYLKHISVELTASNYKSIYIPKGCAHGFKSLQDDTITVYNVATEYNQLSDEGIHYDSLGLDWGVKNPIISKRDTQFLKLKEFKSPF
jgi:dTDP-4-dehydrorhamnose 3,5-epimerase